MHPDRLSALPPELQLGIFQLLSVQALLALRWTSRSFCELIDAHSELIWRGIAIAQSYVDEHTAPCTGYKIGVRYGSCKDLADQAGGSEELEAAKRAQRSGMGCFDDVKTWADFGAC
jgi:hypothetical protein